VSIAIGATASPAARAAAAEQALTAGRSEEAIALARALLDTAPGDSRAWIWFGELLLRAHRPDEALAAYGRAAELNPGLAASFTRQATILFRRAYGPAPRARPAMSAARIQGRFLGSDGRFGNQLLQYGFLRLCAQRYGLELQVPDWIGRDLFEFDDPLPAETLPLRRECDFDVSTVLCGAGAAVVTNVNIQGYFCGSMARWGEVREPLRAVFRLGARLAPKVTRALEALRARGATVIAVHLRRGDFGYGRFWIAPSSWFARWLRDIWAGLDRPVLYVASDCAQVARELAEFQPVTAAELGIEIVGAPFLVDFEVLRNADLLAVSNSSFSFVAALLNTRARTFVRPDPDLRRLRPMSPWSEPVLLDPTAAAGSAALRAGT